MIEDVKENITIEEVKNQYIKWKLKRKSKYDKIPRLVWKNIQKLVKNYPVKKIVESLNLSSRYRIKLVQLMDTHIKNGEELHGRKKHRYAEKLKKEIIITSKKEGLKLHDLSERFNVPYGTVKSWIHTENKDNNMVKRRISPRLIDMETIREHLEKYPEYPIHKRAKLLNISPNMVFRKTRELGYIRKDGKYIKGEDNLKIALKTLSNSPVRKVKSYKPAEFVPVSEALKMIDDATKKARESTETYINHRDLVLTRPRVEVPKDEILDIPEFLKKRLPDGGISEKDIPKLHNWSEIPDCEEKNIKIVHTKIENYMFITKICFCLLVYSLWMFKIPYYQMLSLLSITYCLFSIIEYFILCSHWQDK